jgi:hypothetical protein
MNFADWCEHVLHKVIQLVSSPEAIRLGYLTDNALAKELLGAEMSDTFIGSKQRESFIALLMSSYQTALSSRRSSAKCIESTLRGLAK